MVNTTRRHFLKKAGTALALIPFFDRQANAANNATVRAQLQYQNTPKDGMSCASCLEFLPVQSDPNTGGCKLIPDDDEISPNGYCTKWNTM